MTRKSFNEKLLDSKDMPKVVEVLDPKAVARYGGTKMLIAPPLAYDEVMKKIPYGKVMTADYLRHYLAKKHEADYTCLLTGGLFINIAAHAVVERAEKGVMSTPYWRVLKKDGELNEKYPGGIEGHQTLLEAERHTIIRKGKRYFVEDYQEKTFELE
jgi:hypothetical protein